MTAALAIQPHRSLSAAATVLTIVLQGCIYLPRTTTVYDQNCKVQARQMTMELTQIIGFGRCQGQGCAELLVAAGAVTAASAVVTGSIVVTGNIVYWFEKQGRCFASPNAAAAP
jgi:hypothetical protein